MSSGQPWSLRGLDPKAREIAKDLAHRAGLSLGDWLHQVMVEEGLAPPSPYAPSYPSPYQGRPDYPPIGYGQDRFGPGPAQPVYGQDSVQARISAVEEKSEETGRAVEALNTRLTENHGQMSESLAGFELALKALRADQIKIHRHIRTLATDRAPVRALDGLRALEGAMSKLVVRMRQDHKQSKLSLDQIRAELSEVHGRVDQVESAANGKHVLAEQWQSDAAHLSQKLAAAEAEQAAALARLDQAVHQLQDRVKLIQADGQAELAKSNAANVQRLGALGEDVQTQIDEVRTEVSKSVAAELDHKIDAVNGALDQVGRYLEASDKRTADALDGVGAEITRLGTSLDQRLTLADRNRSQAIDRLKSEMFRVIERISERLSHSERRAEQASEDVDKQVARAVDHIAERADRSASDLGDRVRQSEDRIAYLLDEARARLDRHLAQDHGKSARKSDAASAPKAAPVADPYTSVRPDPNAIKAAQAVAPVEGFDVQDFAFDLKQVEASFTNSFDDDPVEAEPTAPNSDGSDPLVQDASWQKAEL